jgi:hypothetical protein
MRLINLYVAVWRLAHYCLRASKWLAMLGLGSPASE